MKTNIASLMLAATILMGSTSCFIRVKARTPRAHARIRVYAPPSENQYQGMNTAEPFRSVDLVSNLNGSESFPFDSAFQ
jgi:hypothetical protein